MKDSKAAKPENSKQRRNREAAERAQKNSAATTSVVDSSPSPVVSSSEPVTVNVVSGDRKMDLNRNTAPRKGSSIAYNIGDSRLVAKFPRSAFASEPPAVIEIQDGVFSVTGRVAKAKMSVEERTAARNAEKARVASLTPEQRKAEANAKVQARADRLSKQLAAANAKLAGA